MGRLTAALAVGSLALALASPAGAQEADAVSPDGKGIVGGALLGGEVVMITMAAIGVEKGWPYLVFGGLGAVGGGVAGFFIEDAVGETAEIPVYMLAGGMALVIPTIVATLNATAYKPPESDTQPVPAQPAAEPPAPKASVTVTSQAPVPAAAPKTSARDARPSGETSRIPTSIVDLYQGDLALGLPAIQIRPLYSRRELGVWGVEQGEELRVPVLRAQF